MIRESLKMPLSLFEYYKRCCFHTHTQSELNCKFRRGKRIWQKLLVRVLFFAWNLLEISRVMLSLNHLHCQCLAAVMLNPKS